MKSKLLSTMALLVLVFSSISFAFPDIRLTAIDAPSQIEKDQSFRILAYLENLNSKSTINPSAAKVECGIYADSFVTGGISKFIN